MIANRALRWVLWATLAATVFVALQADDEAPNVAQPVAASRRPAAASTAAAGPTDPTRRADWPPAPRARSGADWPSLLPAALAAWQPPPPPPPPPAPVPPPAAPAPPPAPAFPYTLIGRVEEGGKVQVLLSGPIRTISARLDDVIDGQWRLESLQPGGVVVVWMPGGQRLTVNYRPS